MQGCGTTSGSTDDAAAAGMKTGTHSYKDDPMNKDVYIGIRDGVTGRFDLVRVCCLLYFALLLSQIV